MAIIDDIVEAVRPELDAIHASLQEALQAVLATSFSSPKQAANTRAMILELDESIRNIKSQAVEAFITYSPIQYGTLRIAVPAAELGDDAASGDLEVVVTGKRVFIRSSWTETVLVD